MANPDDDFDKAIEVFKEISGFTDDHFAKAGVAAVTVSVMVEWYPWALHWFWLHGVSVVDMHSSLMPYINEDAEWLLSPHAVAIYKAKVIRRLNGNGQD